MDEWSRDFVNWAVVDTVCFKLFDQAATPLAFAKVDSGRSATGRATSSSRRAGLGRSRAWRCTTRFAGRGVRFAPAAGRGGGAGDDRNFVKKAASWG
jgi:hypothetical protein